MAKKRHHDSKREDGRGMMARRMDNEMGHGSSMRSEKHGYASYGENMKRRYDNSDPVPNTVSGLEAREAYSGYKESRRMMARDGAMIREDMSAPALLPKNVIDEYWPRAANYHMGYVDDLFYGAQKQMHEDYADFGREMDPKKY
jgi:hypothetical protein